MLRLLCFVSGALMVSVFFNVIVMWVHIAKSSSYPQQKYRYLQARYSESDETSSESEEIRDKHPSKYAFVTCFPFRSQQYKRLPDNNEEYEMDSLSN